MSARLKDRLDSVFKDIRAEHDAEGRLTVVAGAASVHSVLKFLRDEGYDFLQLVSCVDWIGDGELEVVYVLSSYPVEPGTLSPVVLKTRVSRESPSLETAIDVFPVAEPYEREIHELYGVHFEGHPRLTPLFLEREYEIPPFRKDFDTRQYVENLFGNVPPVGEEDQGQ